MDMLYVLNDFFLLSRGEFAVSLISEADEKVRSRWRRSDNLSHEKRPGLGDIIVKEGELSAVLSRTWTTLSSLQGAVDEDEDEILELGRDLIQLNIIKSSSNTIPMKSSSLGASSATASTHFKNLLFSVPVVLSLRIPSPLDLFLTPADLETYSAINAYLLSIRRAHLRLTDLWKITSLRRDHPAPPAPPYGSTVTGRAIVRALRLRRKERTQAIRSVWATSSAAVFFLGETEAYLQGEVVRGAWEGFHRWLTVSERPSTAETQERSEDMWVSAGNMRGTSTPISSTQPSHDPQTLADAHRRYLKSLTAHLLLHTPTFTEPLYHLMQQIDHLVALVHGIHSIWLSLDLESDEGVVDAFSDFHKEEKDVKHQLAIIAGRVKDGIEAIIRSLRDVDQQKLESSFDFGQELSYDSDAYIPEKVGRVDRLLMKLDFGGWFDVEESAQNGDDANTDESQAEE